MTQVDFLDQLVGQDGLGIAFGDQLAVVDDVSGLADIQGFANVVVGWRINCRSMRVSEP